jgi:FKBP-type peptidyl-prolyl cis-trans isomerase FkpA
MSVTAVPLRPIRKGSVLKLWIGLALLALIALAFAWAGTAGQVWQSTPSGLQYKVVKEGEGPNPTVSDIAAVEYTGRLEDGTVFDSNKGAPQPLIIPVAPGGSIKGFSEGLQLMKKGGTYRLRMPPELAYGAQGSPPTIPANATLEFEVTLLEFIPAAQLQGMMGGPGGPGGPPGQAPPGGPR